MDDGWPKITVTPHPTRGHMAVIREPNDTYQGYGATEHAARDHVVWVYLTAQRHMHEAPTARPPT